LSTKINALVGQHGLPVRLTLTAGQAHDKHAVPTLLLGVPAGADVVADRGYDNPTVLDDIEAAKATAHIPTTKRKRTQRRVDPALYRHRNLIERCFNRLKHFRRIATRYDKLARNFAPAIALVAVVIWWAN
jgi:transposase